MHDHKKSRYLYWVCWLDNVFYRLSDAKYFFFISSLATYHDTYDKVQKGIRETLLSFSRSFSKRIK